MNKSKMFSTVLLALVPLLGAAAAGDLPCTEVKAVDNFKMDAFATGIWYEIARYPTAWEDHSDCLVAKFSRDGNTYKFNISDVFDNTHKSGTFGGDVEVAGAADTGVINYISPTYKDFTGTNKMTARIVDVNYDHYCIFYECEFDANKNIRKDHVWVLSRSKVLEPKARKDLEDFFAANKNLDLNKLIWVKFTEESCKSKA